MQEQENTLGRTIINHMALLAIAAAVLGGLYLISRNVSATVFTGIVLALAHVGAVGVILLAGGGLLRRLGRMVHGTPAGHEHGHSHGGVGDDLETSGHTIRWAFLYDVLVKVVLMGRERQFREAVVRLAEIQPGERVLDVGCGTGKLTITAKQQAPGAVVVGTDAAVEMIERARHLAAKAGVDIDFQAGLGEALRFDDDSFDVVLSAFTVHHMPGDVKIKAFAEMRRVLKPGGRLLLVEFEPPKRRLGRLVLRPLVGKGMLQIDTGKIAPLLEAAGLVSVKSGNAGHPLATYVSGIVPGEKA